MKAIIVFTSRKKIFVGCIVCIVVLIYQLADSCRHDFTPDPTTVISSEQEPFLKAGIVWEFL